MAHDIGAEIVSADAFQIYRGLDLLTAKPDDDRAPDIHSAEWIERRTISVEPEALHNGFRYQVPTEVFVPVESPHIQAVQRLHAARLREPRRGPRSTGGAQRHRDNQAA